MVDWHVTYLVLSMFAALPVAILLILRKEGLCTTVLMVLAWGWAIMSALVK